jgi:hypothetical protein
LADRAATTVICQLHELLTFVILFFPRTATSLCHRNVTVAAPSNTLLDLLYSSRGSRSQVVAKSAGSGEPDFTSMDALYLPNLIFKTGDFSSSRP